MAISKARKDELVAQYKELIDKSDGIFLAEYTGMSVNEMESLRIKISEAEGGFYVTKNTLLKIALAESDRPVPEDMLIGQVATGFALGEAPTLAKAMADFAKSSDNLTLKGGLMENETLTAQQIEALASLPSLDQLRGQILGLISAPAQGIVSALTNGVRQVINVVDAYAKSEEGEAEAEAA